MQRPIITIIGAGFGGAWAARKLIHRQFRVRLIDPDTFFTFTPLLHEVATGTLKATDVTFNIRSFITSRRLECVKGLVIKIDFDKKIIFLADGRQLVYEFLIIAAGARAAKPPIAGIVNALSLKTIADALIIRQKIQQLVNSGQEEININVIGGGFTGLELAGELNQLFTKKFNFRANINIFEKGDLPLTKSDKILANYLEDYFKKSNIVFHPFCEVTAVTEKTVLVNNQSFPSDLTILTAGVMPNTDLADRFKDNNANLMVTKYLNLEKFAEVFAVGDCLTIAGEGKPPMLAQTAVQQAAWAVKNIINQINKQTLQPYQFKLKGVLVSLGTWQAIGRIFGWPIRGRLTWYIWRTVYLFKTPGWKNKWHVAISWTIYLFYKRRFINKSKI